MTFCVRAARYDDIPAIARAESLYIDCAWTAEQIERELDNPNVVFLVAECDGAVVGYISAELAADECEISNIAVEADYRRSGIGSGLFAELLTRVRAKNATTVFLLVRTDNTAAIALYRKFGFENVGLRRGYYKGHDAVIMRLIQ